MSADASLLDHAKHFLGRFGLHGNRKSDNKPRRLEKFTSGSTQGYSARRLNKIASKMRNCNRYLEVGVAQGLTLERVSVAHRTAVDPEPQFDSKRLPSGVDFFQGTSDEFFNQLNPNQEFDLIFLDGLHHWQQTYRDLLSTLNHAAPGALVLIDDVVPDDELSAMTDYAAALKAKDAAGIHDGRWHGDVFKLLQVLADHHPELKVALLRNSTAESDNPQALVWIEGGELQRYGLERVDALSRSYDDLSFNDVFGSSDDLDGATILEEDVAIELALRGIAPFRR